MKQESVTKILNTIDSCESWDQFLTTFQWIDELRRIQHFSPGQLREINEARLDIANKLQERGI